LVKFWDTSALVPLFADEAMTSAVRDILSLDSKVIVWSLTRVELASAMWRRNPPPKASRATAIVEVKRAWSEWSEVTDSRLSLTARCHYANVIDCGPATHFN
jgi:uncharacterized protein with PIN domain